MRCWRVGAARGGEGRGKLDDRRREPWGESRGSIPYTIGGEGLEYGCASSCG